MREPAVGDTIDQYQLTDFLARSGMASIFKGKDLESNAPVVLKIPHLQFESDVVFYERFRREEEIGQRLDHPNIVKVYRPRQKSRMYLAMEWIDGTPLRKLLQEEGPLEPARALAIAQQICEALAYLHQNGVVHRDLKPENILRTPSGQIKIIDFGIALEKAGRRLTWFGLSSTIGTPDYIAPEQVGGRRGDARTDVYAVGTLLYEMITGHLPFSDENAFALMKAKTSEDPRPPSYWLPGLDPSLEAILLKALARSPRDRYPDMAQLLRDLRNPKAVTPHDREAAGRRRALASRKLRVRLAIAAVLAGLSTLVWLSGRAQPAPAPQPAAEGR